MKLNNVCESLEDIPNWGKMCIEKHRIQKGLKAKGVFEYSYIANIYNVL